MESLDGFVPASLLRRLARPGHDGAAAGCTTFSGAVLFVDISGYTALAETLCARGPDGTEQLGRILDRSLRSCVGAVRGTGGEIAAFAGDAFLAYWAADNGPIDAALRSANGAAAALHAIARAA